MLTLQPIAEEETPATTSTIRKPPNRSSVNRSKSDTQLHSKLSSKEKRMPQIQNKPSTSTSAQVDTDATLPAPDEVQDCTSFPAFPKPEIKQMKRVKKSGLLQIFGLQKRLASYWESLSAVLSSWKLSTESSSAHRHPFHIQWKSILRSVIPNLCFPFKHQAAIHHLKHIPVVWFGVELLWNQQDLRRMLSKLVFCTKMSTNNRRWWLIRMSTGFPPSPNQELTKVHTALHNGSNICGQESIDDFQWFCSSERQWTSHRDYSSFQNGKKTMNSEDHKLQLKYSSHEFSLWSIPETPLAGVLLAWRYYIPKNNFADICFCNLPDRTEAIKSA